MFRSLQIDSAKSRRRNAPWAFLAADTGARYSNFHEVAVKQATTARAIERRLFAAAKVGNSSPTPPAAASKLGVQI
jgi:hypothetical protein